MNGYVKRRLKAMEQFQSEESAEGILYLLYRRQNEKYSSGINHWKDLYEEYSQAQEDTGIKLLGEVFI